MSVWDDAVNVLFTDPAFSVAGTFARPPAAPSTVRVILRRHDPEINAAVTHVRSRGFEAYLRTADVAEPRDGDTLTVGATTYTVRDAELDAHGLKWRCDVDATGG